VGGFLRTSFNRATNVEGKVADFRRASFYPAANMQGKMASFRRSSFYRATTTQMVSASHQTRIFLSRHKQAGGKWLRADGQQSRRAHT